MAVVVHRYNPSPENDETVETLFGYREDVKNAFQLYSCYRYQHRSYPGLLMSRLPARVDSWAPRVDGNGIIAFAGKGASVPIETRSGL